MLNIHLDQEKSILYLKPNSALSVEDFSQVSAVIDPYIEQHGSLKGFVIETVKFPGWKNFSAFIAHVKFIKNHHAHIQKVAAVTDSRFADIAKTCVGLFVKPQIQRFPYGQTALAVQWIEQ